MRVVLFSSWVAVVSVVVSGTAFGQAPTQPPAGGRGGGRPAAKTWDQVVDSAVGYLRTKQADDGSWSKANSPGITAVCLDGLFKSGKVTADDPMAAKGLKFIETLVDPADGSLAVGDIRQKNYITSVNLAALKAAGVKGKYDTVIGKAAIYLKKNQIGDSDGKTADDVQFGGFGYGPATPRGDLSNTALVLEAVVAAGTPKDDPVFKRAAVFVSRFQNYKSEHNTQPWAAKIDDGSFIYTLGGGGPMGATAPDPNAAKPGYGSMTFAGLKSLYLCGVPKEDPRVKKGLEWVAKNYSVDLNPGQPAGSGGKGYYYNLFAMAKAFDALGISEVTRADGVKHDWRVEITRALTNRQKPDGSWTGEIATWMETNPDLCTAYALIVLSHTKPATK